MKTWILTTSYLDNVESVGIYADYPPQELIEDYTFNKAEEYYNKYGETIDNVDIEDDYPDEDERFSEFLNSFEYSLTEGDISEMNLIYDER